MLQTLFTQSQMNEDPLSQDSFLWVTLFLAYILKEMLLLQLTWTYEGIIRVYIHRHILATA